MIKRIYLEFLELFSHTNREPESLIWLQAYLQTYKWRLFEAYQVNTNNPQIEYFWEQVLFFARETSPTHDLYDLERIEICFYRLYPILEN